MTSTCGLEVTRRKFSFEIKHSNVKKVNKNFALVGDDLESSNPRKPRSVKFYGRALVVDHKGGFGTGKYIRTTPNIS